MESELVEVVLVSGKYWVGDATFPRIMAPPSRSLVTIKASFVGVQFANAFEPAAVGISYVSMLSLISIGTQKSGNCFYDSVVQFER